MGDELEKSARRAERLMVGSIGHGVSIELRYLDGHLEGVHYWHPRPDNGEECQGYISFKPWWDDGWDLLSEKPLTVHPSLLCRVCQHHGFIQNGVWRPA